MKKGYSAILTVYFMLFLFGSFFGACVPAPGDLKPAEREGYEIYRVYCHQCHTLQSPKLHTAGAWPDVVEKMKRYTEEKHKKKLDGGQTEKLLIFLKGQARK